MIFCKETPLKSPRSSSRNCGVCSIFPSRELVHIDDVLWERQNTRRLICEARDKLARNGKEKELRWLASAVQGATSCVSFDDSRSDVRRAHSLESYLPCLVLHPYLQRISCKDSLIIWLSSTLQSCLIDICLGMSMQSLFKHRSRTSPDADPENFMPDSESVP